MRAVVPTILLLVTAGRALTAQQLAPAAVADAAEHRAVLQVDPTTTPVAYHPAPAHGLTLHLRAGDRVRLEPSEAASGRVTARIASVHPQWVAYALPGAESRVLAERLTAFQGVQISQGRSRSRSARWGAAWGAYLGGASGAIAGPLTALAMDRSVGSSVALLCVGGGVAGAAVGALAGALLAPERWRPFRVARER